MRKQAIRKISQYFSLEFQIVLAQRVNTSAAIKKAHVLQTHPHHPRTYLEKVLLDQLLQQFGARRSHFGLGAAARLALGNHSGCERGCVWCEWGWWVGWVGEWCVSVRMPENVFQQHQTEGRNAKRKIQGSQNVRESSRRQKLRWQWLRNTIFLHTFILLGEKSSMQIALASEPPNLRPRHCHPGRPLHHDSPCAES
jgi:hypothetical protein